MKTFKHLFTVLLLLCTTMATAHNFEVGGIYYNIIYATNKTVEVTYRGTSYNEYSNEYTGSVVIPESVTYNGATYSVRSIGDDAFSGCTGLTSVVIHNSVTSIGDLAFYNCTGLTSITIPNSVRSIGIAAFYGCIGLTRISVESGNTIYDSRNNCNAIIETETNKLMAGCQNTIIPNSVTSIGDYAFNGCTGLTSITIPNSVTSIGDYAFNGCTGLTSVEFNAENCTRMGSSSYPVFSGCAALSTVTFGENVKNIPSYAFRGCTGLTSIEIPNSVTSIGGSAFSGCKGLTSVTIPNSVTSIGSNAFYYCTGLTSVVIGNSVTSIGNYAFYYCTGLTSVVIGNSVTSIGNYAFYYCTGLTSITIPNSVTSIDNDAFCGCASLKELRIEDGEETLNLGYNDAHSNSPNGLFYDCPLETLYLGRNLSYNTHYSIGYSPFYNIETLVNVTFGKNVTTIGSNAFYYCTGLTSVVIGNSVTSIGDDAFYYCTGLTSITIGNSVTSIGDYAFAYCTGLKTVINFSNLTFSKGSSNNGYVAYYATKVINAPNAVIDGDLIWCNLNGANTLACYIGEEPELTLPADYNGENYVIGNDAFNGCSGLTRIEIPNSVTSIGNSAFSGCTGLEKVCINDLAAWCGIDFGSADANPLYYAKNLYLNGELLTELSIPAEIAEVKDYAFYNCNGVTNIDIVDGVKSIGNSAFYGCSDLETLYISNTIESIGDYAFAECNNIFDIKIGSKKAITASENIFSSDAYNNACLYVPTGRKDFYGKTSPWSNFIISEMDFTGIEDVEAEGERVKDVYYDLSGRVVENPTNGVYIINGKKVLIK